VGALLGRVFSEADFTGEALAFWRQLRAFTEGRQADAAALDEALGEAMDTVARALASARRPVIVCSASTMPPQWPGLAAGVARLLRREGGGDKAEVRPGLFCLLPRADSLGASLLAGDDGAGLEGRLLADGAGPSVKALVCIGGDPLGEHPGARAMEAAVRGLDLLVCADCAPSATWAAAQVALPLRTLFETGGCLVNNHGLLQRAEPVFAGGAPVTQDGHGSHPPRVPGAGVPGNDPRDVQGWAELLAPGGGDGESSPAEDRLRAAMREASADHGVAVLPPRADVRFPSLDWLDAFAADGGGAGQCDVLVTDSTFGSDRLANYGEPGRELLPEPCVRMRPEDAAALHFEDGSPVLLSLAQGVVRTVLRCNGDMARNTAVLPRMPGSGWRLAGAPASSVPVEGLWREQGDEGEAAAARIDTDDSCPGGNV
jgi:hypothetical protein